MFAGTKVHLFSEKMRFFSNYSELSHFSQFFNIS